MFGKNLRFGPDWGFEYGASHALIGIVKNQGIQIILLASIFLLLLVDVVHHW